MGELLQQPGEGSKMRTAHRAFGGIIWQSCASVARKPCRKCRTGALVKGSVRRGRRVRADRVRRRGGT